MKKPSSYIIALTSLVVLSILAFAVYWFIALSGAFPWTTAQEKAAAGPKLVISELTGEVTTFWMLPFPASSPKGKLAEVHHREGYGVRAQVSPDGKKLAYTLFPPEGKEPDTDGTLWVMNLDGTGQKLLASGIDLRGMPLWSWNGARLLAKRSMAGGGTQILVVDGEGGRVETLVTDQAALGLSPIGWAKDDSRIYYAVISPKGVDIASVDLDKATLIIGQASQGPARDFRLSPDGTKIAYVAQSRADGKDLYRIMAISTTSGSGPQVLAEKDSYYFGPIWQPQGQGITYGTHTSDPAGKVGILKFNPSGGWDQTNLQAKLDQSGFYVPLAWSPESKYLAVRYLKGSPEQPTSESLLILWDKSSWEVPASGYVEFVGWLPSP